jgi:peptide-methionine (S)-S-oxide reductase
VYYITDAQRAEAERTRDLYAPVIKPLGYGDITTEIAPATTFYYAEGYHQQYLHKNPNGYRCHSNTGARFPAEV